MKIYLVSMLSCLTFLLNGQTVVFQKVYGGNGTDWGMEVQQTYDGGYIIAGYTNSFTSGTDDFYLIKVDSGGNTVWTKTYGGITEDAAKSVQQTLDSGYIVVGITQNPTTNNNILLMKTYFDGSVQWQNIFLEIGYQQGFSVKQTIDGGYIIGGSTTNTSDGKYNIYMMKTNSFGDSLWTRNIYLEPGNDDEAYSIQQTTDGGYILAGYTYNSVSLAKDALLIKTNSNGDTLWTKLYGGTGLDYGNSVQQTSDGGYIVTGYTESFGPASGNAYLVKTDANGDTVWTRGISNAGTAGAKAFSVQQTTDGGYILSGQHGYSGQWSNIYLAKTNSNGDTLWTRSYGGTLYEDSRCVRQTKDGGYVILGNTDSYEPAYQNIYLIKTDSLGNTGAWNAINKYSKNPLEVSIFPNPFVAQANLLLPQRFVMNENTELRIYDMYGNETTRVMVASDNAIIQRGNLAAGMYFCKVISNNTVVATGKFIIQ